MSEDAENFQKEQECQTQIHCFPHIINEYERAAVVQDEACQTVIVLSPDGSEDEMISRLQCVDPEELYANSERILEMYMTRTKLQWRFPAATTKIFDPTKHPLEDRPRKSSIDEPLYSNYAEVQDVIVSLLKSAGSETGAVDDSKVDIYRTSGAAPFTTFKENECQTKLTITPLVLSETNPTIHIVTSISTQTSITKLSVEENDVFIDLLQTYLPHDIDVTASEVTSVSEVSSTPHTTNQIESDLESEPFQECVPSEVEEGLEEVKLEEPDVVIENAIDVVEVLEKIESEPKVSDARHEVILKNALDKSITAISEELEFLKEAYTKMISKKTFITTSSSEDESDDKKLSKRKEFPSRIPSLLYQFPSSQKVYYEPYMMHLESELKFEVQNVRESLNRGKQSLKELVEFSCTGSQIAEDRSGPSQNQKQCRCVLCTCDFCRYLIDELADAEVGEDEGNIIFTSQIAEASDQPVGGNGSIEQIAEAADQPVEGNGSIEQMAEAVEQITTEMSSKEVLGETLAAYKSGELVVVTAPTYVEPYIEPTVEITEETKQESKIDVEARPDVQESSQLAEELNKTDDSSSPENEGEGTTKPEVSNPQLSSKQPHYYEPYLDALVDEVNNAEPEAQLMRSDSKILATRTPNIIEPYLEPYILEPEPVKDVKPESVQEPPINAQIPPTNAQIPPNADPLLLMFPSSQKERMDEYVTKFKTVFPRDVIQTVPIDPLVCDEVESDDDCVCHPQSIKKDVKIKNENFFNNLGESTEENCLSLMPTGIKKNIMSNLQKSAAAQLGKSTDLKNQFPSTDKTKHIKYTPPNKSTTNKVEAGYLSSGGEDDFCDCVENVEDLERIESRNPTNAPQKPCICEICDSTPVKDACVCDVCESPKTTVLNHFKSASSNTTGQSNVTRFMPVPPNSIRDFHGPLSISSTPMNSEHSYAGTQSKDAYAYSSQPCLCKSLSNISKSTISSYSKARVQNRKVRSTSDIKGTEKEINVTELNNMDSPKKRSANSRFRKESSDKIHEICFKTLSVSTNSTNISIVRDVDVVGAIKFQLLIDRSLLDDATPHSVSITVEIVKDDELNSEDVGKYEQVIRLKVKYQKREPSDTVRPDIFLNLEKCKEHIESKFCKHFPISYLVALAGMLYREPHIANIASEFIISADATNPEVLGQLPTVLSYQAIKSFPDEGNKFGVSIETKMSSDDENQQVSNVQPYIKLIHGPGTFSVPVNLMISVTPNPDYAKNNRLTGDAYDDSSSETKSLVFRYSREYNEPYTEELLYGSEINFGPTSQLYEEPPVYNEPYVESLFRDDDVEPEPPSKLFPLSEDEYETSSEGRCGSKTEIPWFAIAVPPPGTLKILPPEKPKRKKKKVKPEGEEGEEGAEGEEEEEEEEDEEEEEPLVEAPPPPPPVEDEEEPPPRPPEFDYVYRHAETAKYTEPYMDKMLKAYPDTGSGACPRNPELPWAEISLQKGFKISAPKPKQADKKCVCKTCKHMKPGHSSKKIDQAPSKTVSRLPPSNRTAPCRPVNDKRTDFRQFDNELASTRNAKNTMHPTSSGCSTKSSEHVPKKSPKRPSLVEDEVASLRGARFNVPPVSSGTKSVISAIIPIKPSTLCTFNSNVFQMTGGQPSRNPFSKDSCGIGSKSSDDPVVAAFANYEKEIRPLHNTLAELQYKIRNLNIPELRDFGQPPKINSKTSKQSTTQTYKDFPKTPQKMNAQPSPYNSMGICCPPPPPNSFGYAYSPYGAMYGQQYNMPMGGMSQPGNMYPNNYPQLMSVNQPNRQMPSSVANRQMPSSMSNRQMPASESNRQMPVNIKPAEKLIPDTASIISDGLQVTTKKTSVSIQSLSIEKMDRQKESQSGLGCSLPITEMYEAIAENTPKNTFGCTPLLTDPSDAMFKGNKRNRNAPTRTKRRF